MNFLQNDIWELEILRNDVQLGKFGYALFDFDGTISLIREGWQEVMVPYFTEVLLEVSPDQDEVEVAQHVRDFVDFLTGKQTIYQCIQLAEEVRLAGGEPLDPFEYKKEYHERLMQRINHKVSGLRTGEIDPSDLIVPGAVHFLRELQDRGITLYLASGTDENYVIKEAELLGVAGLFDGGVHGARDEYLLFSKEKVIQSILATHGISGDELVGFGDGYVEIENIKAAGGLAVGVASDEVSRCGVDEWKRDRLIRAGADAVIPDFRDVQAIIRYLYP